METINLYGGWAGILLGFVAGAVPGLFFHDELWLGGYASWRRRMIRLAHISFFGIGFINLAFFFTVRSLQVQPAAWSSVLLVIGAVAMPLVCYLSAFRTGFRHLFPIPVVCLLASVASFIWEILPK